MSKKSFKDLTIVSVTGDTQYIQGSIYAIQRSCDELKGAKGLLISPALPEGVFLPDNIVHREIVPFSYLEYNIFILYQLDYFIETDYCLVVQNDGWVLNGKLWRDEFWDYDYIGAPVPTYCYYDEERTFRTVSTQTYLENPHLSNDPRYMEPQNGGFSLRSKKLLKMPRLLDLGYRVPTPEPVKTLDGAYKIEWLPKIHHEDIFLTAYFRHILEQNGVRFAPIELAYDFSLESPFLHEIRNKPFINSMGCHLFGHVKLTGYNELDVYVKPIWKGYPLEVIAEIDYVKFFLNYGYKIKIFFIGD